MSYAAGVTRIGARRMYAPRLRRTFLWRRRKDLTTPAYRAQDSFQTPIQLLKPEKWENQSLWVRIARLERGGDVKL